MQKPQTVSTAAIAVWRLSCCKSKAQVISIEKAFGVVLPHNSKLYAQCKPNNGRHV